MGRRLRVASFVGVVVLLVAAAVGLAGLQLPGPGPFGPLRRGPSGQRIGEMHFAPGGSDMNYSLYGDHCELHGDKMLCLFLCTAHTGTAKEWSSQKAWMENYATDQFGEKHYKTGAFSERAREPAVVRDAGRRGSDLLCAGVREWGAGDNPAQHYQPAGGDSRIAGAVANPQIIVFATRFR